MIRKKIGVLLPFKDHFTNSGAGSASIWIKDFNKNSLYKNDILVCGNTDSLKDIIDKKRYKNLNFKTLSFRSKNLSYVNEFIKLYNKYKFKYIIGHHIYDI